MLGVALYMLENRGLNRGRIITGSSVHNCRVECTHKGVYAGVLCHFANIFSGMEDMGLIDPLNEVHLFSLHFVYIPRITRALQHFISHWNNHPVSSEYQLSPLQTFATGILKTCTLDTLELRVFYIQMKFHHMGLIQMDLSR